MLEAIKNIILDHGVTLFVFGVAITLIMIGIRAKWVWVKQVFFNLAGICVAIGFYGIYLSWTAQTDHTPIPTYDGNPLYFADKTIVGYGPGSTFDGSIHSTKLHTDDSSVIYDVQYNFKSGWRHCAASDSTSTYHAILLGGSFAFGEGLGDEHTIPYQFQSATDTSFALRNYGFHGHGSHQALSIVEHILTQDTALLRAADVHIYYFSIADHIRRAAGKTFWDVRGPWYEMEGEQLAYKGTFKELHAGQIPPGYLTTKLQMMGQRSALYQKFFGISLTNTEVDFIRFEAIIPAYAPVTTATGNDFAPHHSIPSPHRGRNLLLPQADARRHATRWNRYHRRDRSDRT